jgi:hypothetical protein
MKFSDINVDNIHSQLIDEMKENGEIDDIEIPIAMIEQVINDFNACIVNLDNINDIISLCDFLMVDNTKDFIT